MDKAGFDKWLAHNFKGGHQGRRDIISRAQRAENILSLDLNVSDNEFRFKLGEELDKQSVSGTVKSQLKRAATLYRQYIREGT